METRRGHCQAGITAFNLRGEPGSAVNALPIASGEGTMPRSRSQAEGAHRRPVICGHVTQHCIQNLNRPPLARGPGGGSESQGSAAQCRQTSPSPRPILLLLGVTQRSSSWLQRELTSLVMLIKVEMTRVCNYRGRLGTQKPTCS